MAINKDLLERTKKILNGENPYSQPKQYDIYDVSKMTTTTKHLLGINMSQEEISRRLDEEEAKKLRASEKTRLEQVIGFDTFSNDINSMNGTLNGIYSGWQDKNTMSTTKSSVENMYNRLASYENYRKYFGDDSFTDLSELTSQYKGALDDWDKLSEQYGSFNNADEYAVAVKQYEADVNYKERMRKANLLEEESELAYMQTELAIAKKKKAEDDSKEDAYIDNMDATDYTDTTRSKGRAGASRRNNSGYRKYLSSIGYNSIEELEAAINEKSSFIEDAKLYQTEQKALNAEDFEKYSQIGAGIENPSYNEANGWLHAGTYIIGGEEVKNPATFAKENSDTLRMGGVAGNVLYTYLTDDELGIHNYYLGLETEGKVEKGTAQKYLDSIEGRLKERHENEWIEAFDNFAHESPVLGSAVSVWYSLGGATEHVYDSIKYGKTGEMDSNFNAKVSSTIRSRVSQDVDWEIGNWDAFDFVYNTGMSMADTVAATALTGGNAFASGTMLGLSAAGQGVNDALERGLSDKQAFWNGFMSGCFEMAFESISIGKVLDNVKIKGNFKRLASNMLVNASEETFTELANIAYDTIHGELSHYNLRVKELVDSGEYTQSEAESIAKKELRHQVYEATASGAFMGFGFDAVGNAVTGTINHYGKKSFGQSVIDKGNAGRIFQMASEYSEDSEAGKLYKKYSDKNFIGDDAKPIVVGNLAEKIVSDAEDVLSNKNSTQEQKNKAIQTLIELESLAKPNENISAKDNSINREEPAGSFADNSMEDFFEGLESARNFDFSGNNANAESSAGDVNIDKFKSGLGKNGQKQFERASKDIGSNMNQTVLDAFDAFYNAGKNGLTLQQAQEANSFYLENFPKLAKNNAKAILNSAFFAGQNDASRLNKSSGDSVAVQTKNAIARTADNQRFVIIDRDILAGIDESNWRKVVSENLKNKFPDGIKLGNNQISINQTSRREMTYSEYTKWLAKKNPEIFLDKMRATDNADEMLQVASGWINEGLNHPRKDKIKNFARGSVLIRIANKDYSADVIVGTTGSGQMLLYDIINLAPTTIKTKKPVTRIAVRTQNESNNRNNVTDNNSILQKIKNVNRKISGTDMEVGRAVSEADYTNEVLRLAKESGHSDLIRDAEKYENYKFGTNNQRYRAIGSLAKKLGVTYGDLIRSKARSLTDKFVNAISDIDSVDGRIRAGIEKERTSAKARNDKITLAALDHLENILDREGSAIAVNDMFRTTNYSADNPNTAVEVYADSLEKGFKASGLDISVSVYYDNSDTAIRGEWSVDENGHTEIKLNGLMLRGEQSAFWVMSHELFHQAERNSPGITQRVLDVFSDMGIYNEEKQYEAYRERYQGHEDAVAKVEKRDAETLSKDYIDGEIAADLMGETMGSTELLEMFAGKLSDNDRNIFAKLFSKIAGVVKKAVSSDRVFAKKLSDIVSEFEGAVKNNVDNASDKGYNNTRLKLVKLDGANVFPPYNESYSDTNERALRWAHKNDIEDYTQRIFYHEGTRYLVEKDSSLSLGYRVIRRITNNEYNRNKAFYSTIGGDDNGNHSGRKQGRNGIVQSDKNNQIIVESSERGNGHSVSVDKYNGKASGAQGMGSEQNAERKTNVERGRASERGVEDTQGEVKRKFALPDETITSKENVPTKRYSFAGYRAKNADCSMLDIAVQMELDGKSEKTIFRETGWYRGAEGRWRFEISDKNSKYHPGGDAEFSQDHPEYARYMKLYSKLLYDDLSNSEYSEYSKLYGTWERERRRLAARVIKGDVKLKNILSHPRLFEAYPYLKNINVRFANLGKGELGAVIGDTIFISNMLPRDRIKRTLLHEIQHLIQEEEGFATGSSVEYWKSAMPTKNALELYKNTAGEIEARQVQERMDLTDSQRRRKMPFINDENAVLVPGQNLLSEVEDVALTPENNIKMKDEQYTEKQYRDFGWARANNILTAGQNVDYRSKFADAKFGRAKFNKSKKGEYIIPVSDIYDADFEGINNVLVFAKGTIDNPVITSVIVINANNETDLTMIREFIYECERDGIQTEAEGIFKRYNSTDSEFERQESSSGFAYSEQFKNRNRSSEENSSVNIKSEVDFSIEKNRDTSNKSPTYGGNTRYALAGNNTKGSSVSVLETAKTETEFEKEAQEFISYVEKSYKKDSPEYALAMAIVSLEKDRRSVGKRLKSTVTDFKIKSFKADKAKVGKIAHKLAENLGFEKHIPQLKSFEDSLFSFYKMMEDFIDGKISSDDIVSASRDVSNGVVEMSTSSELSEIEQNCSTLVKMDSVSNLTGNELSGDLPLRDKIKKIFESFGGSVHTHRFGDIALSNSSIRSDMRHGTTREKVASYSAIPEVLQNGVVIDSKGKNFGEVERIVVAAPIMIANTPYFMGVMIQRDKTSQRLYLHDVIIKKEASHYQPEHLNTTGPLDNENLFLTDVLEKAVSVGYSISQKDDVVKDNSALSENLAAKLISGYLQAGRIDTKLSVPSLSTLTEKSFSCDDEILKVKDSIPEKSIDELRSEGEALQVQLKELDSRLDAQKKKTAFARLLEAEKKVFGELLEREKKAKNELASDRLERRENEQKEKLFRIIRDLRKKNAKAGPELRAEIEEIFGKYDTLGINISDEGLLNLLDLKAEYEQKKAEGADFISNKEIEKELQRLDEVQIGTMEASEVAAVLEQAIALSHQIKNQNNIIENGKRREAREDAEATVPAVYKSGGMKYDKTIQGLAGRYRMDMLSPVRFFRRILAYETKGGLYERVVSLNNGQRKAMQYRLDFSKPFEKLVHSDNHKEDVRIKKELRDFTGKHARVEKFRVRAVDRLNPDAFYETEIELTPAMKVSLYLSIKNDDFLRHVAYGGLTIPDVELFKKGKYRDAYARGKIVAIMPSELKRIVSDLSDYEMAWADAAENFFNVDSKKAVNRTSVDLYGYELATVDHYFPINTNKNYNATEFESLMRDGTLEGKGFLKERVQSVVPVNIEDVTMVLDRHIKDVSSFAGLALPIRNFNAVFNAKTYGTGKPVTVKEAILKTWGPPAMDYIEKLITDLQSPRKIENGFFAMIDELRSRSAAAIMNVNIPVTLGNFAAYPQAAGVLDWRALGAGLQPSGKYKFDEKIVDKYTPLFAERRAGYTTRELGDIKSQNELAKRNGILEKSFGMMQAVDITVTKWIWQASMEYVSRNNKALKFGTDEYYRAVADIFNRAIEETQPSYTTMQRPEMLRSTNLITREMTMFKSALMQNYNVIYDAIQEYRFVNKNGDKAKIKEAGTRLRRVLVSQGLIVPLVVAGMNLTKIIFGKGTKYRDEEDELTSLSIMQGFFEDFVSNFTAMYPGLEDTINLGGSLLEKASGYDIPGDYKWYDLNSTSFQMINDMYSSINSLLSSMEKYESGDAGFKSVRFAFWKTTEKFAQFFGIPVANINNVIWGSILFAGEKFSGNNHYGSYLRIKWGSDGNTSAVANDMCKVAFEAHSADDIETYRRIKSDMIKEGFITEDKFVKKMKSLEKNKILSDKVEAFKNDEVSPDKVSSDVIKVIYEKQLGRAVYYYERNDFDNASLIVDKISRDSGISSVKIKSLVQKMAAG